MKERWYDNIVLNIPHASTNGIGFTQWENKEMLLPVIRKWTDWYTDLIFIPEKKDRIKTIVADYSRFVVDVERLPDDPLNECGQGIIYTEYNGFHRNVDEEERMVLMGYYYNYIKKLKSMLSDHSLLIDCHSFPSDLNDVDICIGYNDDWSRPTDFIIGLVAESFKRHGLKVEFNTPYSNTIAPETSYTYNSIMIEQGRRSIFLTLYFDSQHPVPSVLVPTAKFPLACNANLLVPCLEHHQRHFS